MCEATIRSRSPRSAHNEKQQVDCPSAPPSSERVASLAVHELHPVAVIHLRDAFILHEEPREKDFVRPADAQVQRRLGLLRELWQLPQRHPTGARGEPLPQALGERLGAPPQLHPLRSSCLWRVFRVRARLHILLHHLKFPFGCRVLPLTAVAPRRTARRAASVVKPCAQAARDEVRLRLAALQYAGRRPARGRERGAAFLHTGRQRVDARIHGRKQAVDRHAKEPLQEVLSVRLVLCVGCRCVEELAGTQDI
mmetsp:Transcript_129574/g.414439  ORF Transcript_129574/g.414439 Transcript_129574/m.414439 type:complete len:253 (+) Transcript_129574:203-961(+)